MKENISIEPNKKDSKLIKTYDLKYLGIITSNEKNPIINFRSLCNTKTNNSIYKQIYFNTPNKITGHKKIIKTSNNNNDEEKLKHFITNKNINNSPTNNDMLPAKKSYCSYSKFKLSDKIVLTESNQTIENTNIKPKTKESKYKNLKIYVKSGTIDYKNISNNYKYNSFSHISNNNKKNNLKNSFIINKRINGKLSNNYINTQSYNHHTTMQSTLPGFSRILSPQKVNLIRKKTKKNTSKTISKKNSSNFDTSKSKNEYINNIKKLNALIKYRKNYPFIINPNPLIPKEFNGLPPHVIKINHKYESILKKENEKVFRQYFSIIGKEKFSKKFQNIVNKYEIEEKSEKKSKNKEIKERNSILKENEQESGNSVNSLVNENIISGTKLLKEIKNEESKQYNILIKTNKKILFNKFKKIILLIHNKLKTMSVYLGEIIATYRIPKMCYGFFATHDLFFAIKTKNYTLANNILDKHKYIVLDYDYFNMTALHWAAKYNFYQIIPKILEYGSFIDKKNYIGDTPLLISVKHKYMETTIFLLLNMASPFEKDNKGLNINDYSHNEFKLKSTIKKIISLHYISFFKPTKKKYEYITREFVEYIVDEYKGDLELEAYNMIKEKFEYYKRKYKNSKL